MAEDLTLDTPTAEAPAGQGIAVMATPARRGINPGRIAAQEMRANYFDQFDEAPPQPNTADATMPVSAPSNESAKNGAPTKGPNYFDQFDAEPDAGEAGLAERWRLNQVEGYYRGTLRGSMEIMGLATDWEHRNDPDQSPELKAWTKERIAKYQQIINDLARYDALRPWGTTAEGATALAGQIVGGLQSPESFLGWGAKGASLAIRTGKAAAQQGAIMAATDPLVQAMDIAGGVQPEGFSWARVGASAGIGAIIGGGLHLGGELISSSTLKAKRADFAAEDPSLRTADDAPAPPKAEPAPEPLPAEAAPAAEANRVQIERALDDHIAEAGFGEVDPKLRKRAVQIMEREGVTDPDVALERAAMQDADRYEKLAKKRTETTGEIPGWDAADTRAAPGAGAGVQQPGPGLEPGRGGEGGRASEGARDSGAGAGEAGDLAPAQDELFMRAPKAEPVASGRIAGVEFKGPLSELEKLEAARRAGAGKDEIQRMVDSFKSQATAPQTAALQERIIGAYQQASGGQFNKPVSLVELRRILADVPRATLDAELKRMHIDEKLHATLSGNNNPASVTAADRGAALNAFGGDKHFLWIAADLRGGPDELAALAQRQSGATLPAEQARPAGGVAAPPPGTPSPQQAAAIRSLQQQATDFAEAIGVPLHQGRITTPGAEGIYKQRAGVVRVKEVPDFEVVSHEAGHAIEAKVGPSLTALTNQHAAELAPLVSNPAAYPPAQHVTEGFAEYIRRYIGNPAAAAQAAPGFSTVFRNFMEAGHPDIIKAIDDAARTYRAYLDAPSVDAVASVHRSRSEEPTGYIARGLAYIRENGLGASFRDLMRSIYQIGWDDISPLARVKRELLGVIKEQQGGQVVDLKAAYDPEILFRLAQGSEQGGTRDALDGVRPYRDVNPRGPSLSAVMAKAAGEPSFFGRYNADKAADFGAYAIARRAEYLWRKFDAGLLDNPPAAFSKADALQAMRDFEAANPTFREASDMLHAYTRELLTKMRDGHLIGTELHDKLQLEEFYVPFYRHMSDKPLAEGGQLRAGAGDRAPEVVKRMVGSARDIKDPIESIMMQTLLVNRAIRHNDAILALRDLAREAKGEGGRYVEDIPANEAKKYTFDLGDALYNKAIDKGMTPVDAGLLRDSMTSAFGEDPLMGRFFRMEPTKARGEPIVFYKEGGELKAARMMAGQEGHALYETITRMPEALQDVIMQGFSAASTTLRAGIVTNPVYALTNYIRDQLAVSILRPDYIPFYSGLKGIKAEFAQSQSAQLYAYAGGVSAGAAVAPLRRAADIELNALARRGYIVQKFSTLTGFLEFTQFTEAGTRNSVFDTVYKAKRAQGLSEYEAMIEAAYGAHDSTIDFSRHGSQTLWVRKLTPFVNSQLQGPEKAYRAMIEPLIREVLTVQDKEAQRNAIIALGKATAVMGALGVGWAALHHDNEIYQDVSPTMRATHFVTTAGGKLFVIPKPFELSLGFTAGELAYQRLKKDDPRAAEQFVKALTETLLPSFPVLSNPAIKVSLELMSNYSSFTGRAIVPDRLQRLPKELQYTDRTSDLAKAISRVIPVSPIKVDHAIGGYFGLNGRDLMALSQGIEEDAPAKSWEDRVFFRRFLKDPTNSSDVTSKFWDFMSQTTGKYNQANNGFMALVGRRSPEGDRLAREFLAKLPENERVFTVMKSAANEDGKMAFSPDERRLHPLSRAYDAVTVLNGVRQELVENRFYTYDEGRPFVLSAQARGDLRDATRELAQKEMRNALVIMKEPGYEGRALLPLDETMAKIRSISPAVADEIGTRYATAKIYPTAPIAKNYDALKREVLRAGSDADTGRMLDAAQDAGFEFGADRVKRPARRRITIPGTPPAPAPAAPSPPAAAPPPAGGPASLNLQ